MRPISNPTTLFMWAGTSATDIESYACAIGATPMFAQNRLYLQTNGGRIIPVIIIFERPMLH